MPAKEKPLMDKPDISPVSISRIITTMYLIGIDSSKQYRVSFSSMGAEIIAAAESADRSSLLSYAINTIIKPIKPIPLILTIDSHGLYSTITTLHEGRDYRLRPTVSRIRDAFESKEISTIQWIAGQKNIADALTKCNPNIYIVLNNILQTKRIPATLFSNLELNSNNSSDSTTNNNIDNN